MGLIIGLSITGLSVIVIACVIWLLIHRRNKIDSKNRKDLQKEFIDNKAWFKNNKPINFNEAKEHKSGIVVSCGIKRFNKIKNRFVIKNLNNKDKTVKILKNKLYFSLGDQKSAVVIAPPGSGKTQALLFPTILYNINCKEKPNIIVTDPKPEILNELYNEFNKNGYQVINLSLKEFATNNGYITDYWNPFDNLITLHKTLLETVDNNKLQNIYASIQNEINLIIDPFYRDSDKKNEYWLNNAKSMINFMICFMLYKVEIKEFDYKHINFKNLVSNLMTINLEELVSVASYLKKKTDDLMSLQNKSKSLYLARYYLSWSGEKLENIKSFHTEAQSKLNVFADNYFGLLTSKSTFDIDKLILSNKPFAFFLTINTSSTAKLSEKSLLNMYLELLNSKITKYKTHNSDFKNRPLYWLIDEAGNIDPINFLNSIIAFGRGQKNFAVPIFQTFEQIESKYGSSLFEACEYRILFNNDNDRLGDRISKLIGNTEINNEKYVSKAEISEICNIPEGNLALWTFKRRSKDKNYYLLPVTYFYMIKGIIKSNSFIKCNESYNLADYEKIVNLISIDNKEINQYRKQLFKTFEIEFDRSKVGYDDFETIKNCLNSIYERFVNFNGTKMIDSENSSYKKLKDNYQKVKDICNAKSSIIGNFISNVERMGLNVYYQDPRFKKDTKEI